MVDKRRYISNGINKFSEKVRSKTGKDFKFYLQKKNEFNYPNIMEAISKIEKINLSELYSLLKDSFLELDDYLKYQIYFSVEEVPDDLRDKVKVVSFPIVSDEPLLISVTSNNEVSSYRERVDIKSTKDNSDIYFKLFSSILENAVDLGVSDIHFVTKENYTYVYYRQYGLFVQVPQFTMPINKWLEFLNFMYYTASEYTKGKFKSDNRWIAQDARIEMPVNGKPFILRIAFTPSGWNERIVDITIRLIRKDGGSLIDIKDLGIYEEDLKLLMNSIKMQGGLIVISGKTNSGKSMLVNNLLKSIDDRKIGTIEDPIEYYIPNPNYIQHQTFVPEDESLKMDFSDFVKSFKRGDYDIVFIGEWRNDKDLTRSIIEQANAGQLVITTLHIPSSFHIYTALRDMYSVEPGKIKSVLILSWSQILLPKLCPYCSKEVENYSFDEDIINMLERRGNKKEAFLINGKNFKARLKGKGCEHCTNGIKGRVPVYDYFVNNPSEFKNDNDYDSVSIMENSEIYKKVKLDIFLRKVEEGLVDPNEIIKII